MRKMHISTYDNIHFYIFIFTSCTLFADNFLFITCVIILKVAHETINRTYTIKAANIAAKKNIYRIVSTSEINNYKKFL